MSNLPFFSVIIPTYNREKLILRAVKSIIKQTYKDFECIVIDDGSTDNTVKILENLKDERIRIVSQSNRGVACARNVGIKESRGKYLAFLDSDDWWMDKKLSITKDFIDNNEDVKIFHTKERWFRRGVELNQRKNHKNPTGWVYEKLIPICCVSVSTLVLNSEILNSIGDFDEDFTVCEDYEFLLRASLHFEMLLIDEVLTEKDGGRDDQLSSRSGLDYYRVLALIKILNTSQLRSQQKDLTIAELKRKFEIYKTGALKRNKQSEVQELQLRILEIM